MRRRNADDASQQDSLENRYSFREDSYGCSVTMKITTRCPDSAINTAAPDGHVKHKRVRYTAKEEICDACDSRTPLSLQKLSAVRIITDDKLIGDAVHLLPPYPLLMLMDVAVNCLPNRAVAGSLSLLLKHWPCADFSLGIVRKRHPDNGFLAGLIIDRFVADLSARIHDQPTSTKLTEFVMTNERNSNYTELYRKLFDVAHDWAMSLCDVDRDSAPTYIITTDLVVGTKRTIRNVITTLRKFKRQGGPVEVRMEDVRLESINLFDTTTLLTEINPAFIKSFSTSLYQGSHLLVLELDEMLRPLVRLASLSLTLESLGVGDEPEEAERLAIAMSQLLSHHPTLKTLSLMHFPMAGNGEKYHLPPMLEELRLDGCDSMHADWQHWANASSTSKLKTLNIMDCALLTDAFNDDGFVDYLKKHAATLVSLSVKMFPPPMTLDALRGLAMHLAPFKSLADFSYVAADRQEVLAVVRDVIPWLMTSDRFHTFSLRCNSRPTTDDDDDFRGSLHRTLRTVFQARGPHLPSIRSVTLAYKTRLDHYPLIFLRFNAGLAGGVGGDGAGMDGEEGGDGGGGFGADGADTGDAADDDAVSDEIDDIPAAGNPNDQDDHGFNDDEDVDEDEEEEEEDLENFGDGDDDDDDDDNDGNM